MQSLTRSFNTLPLHMRNGEMKQTVAHFCLFLLNRSQFSSTFSLDHWCRVGQWANQLPHLLSISLHTRGQSGAKKNIIILIVLYIFACIHVSLRVGQASSYFINKLFSLLSPSTLTQYLLTAHCESEVARRERTKAWEWKRVEKKYSQTLSFSQVNQWAGKCEWRRLSTSWVKQ